MTKKLDIDSDETRINLLVADAKMATGHVYYNTKYTSKVLKDGSRHERIDVYEKYRRPSSWFTSLFKKEGVEVVFHPRRVKS